MATVATGLEIPSRNLRRWSREEDAIIGGQLWVGASNLVFGQYESGVNTDSQLSCSFAGDSVLLASLADFYGQEAVVRWFRVKRSEGQAEPKWVRVPRAFHGQIAHATAVAGVIQLTIDPGPFPREVNDRRWSHQNQMELFSDDRFFEFAEKYKKRNIRYAWPIRLDAITLPDGGPETPTPPENRPVVWNDIPDHDVPADVPVVRVPLGIHAHDPDGDPFTISLTEFPEELGTGRISNPGPVDADTKNEVVLEVRRTLTPFSQVSNQQVTVQALDAPPGSNIPSSRSFNLNFLPRSVRGVICVEDPYFYLDEGVTPPPLSIEDFISPGVLADGTPVTMEQVDLTEVTVNRADRANVTAEVSDTARAIDFSDLKPDTDIGGTFTVAQTVGVLDPAVCIWRGSIRADLPFEWRDDIPDPIESIRVPESDDDDIVFARVNVARHGLPSYNTSFRVKTQPDAAKGSASISGNWLTLALTPAEITAARAWEEDDDPAVYPVVVAGKKVTGLNRQEADHTFNFQLIPKASVSPTFELECRDIPESVLIPIGLEQGETVNLAVHIFEKNTGFNAPVATIISLTSSHEENILAVKEEHDDPRQQAIVRMTSTQEGTSTITAMVKLPFQEDSDAIECSFHARSYVFATIFPQQVVPHQNRRWQLQRWWSTPTHFNDNDVVIFNYNRITWPRSRFLWNTDNFHTYLPENEGPPHSSAWTVDEWENGFILGTTTEIPSVFNRYQCWIYTNLGIHQQDCLVIPFQSWDVLSAPGAQGPPYTPTKGFIAGIVPGNVVPGAGAGFGTAGGTEGLRDALGGPFTGRVSQINLPKESISAYIATADIIQQVVNRAVDAGRGGSTVLSRTSVTLSYSPQQFEGAITMAKAVQDTITPLQRVGLSNDQIGRIIGDVVERTMAQTSITGSLTAIFAPGTLISFLTAGAVAARDATIRGALELITTTEIYQMSEALTTGTTSIADFIAQWEGIKAAEQWTEIGRVISTAGSANPGRAGTAAGGTTPGGTEVVNVTDAGGVVQSGGTTFQGGAVADVAAQDGVAAVASSAWSQFFQFLSAISWFRTFVQLVDRILRTNSITFDTSDHNIAQVEGNARTGLGLSRDKYGVRVVFKNPGMTLVLITGIVDGRIVRRSPIPLVIVVGDPAPLDGAASGQSFSGHFREGW